MSRTFLSVAHLRTWDQASCRYTHSSRLSNDKLYCLFVTMLPEVEKRRSGEADVAGIFSTRRARRESHGKIWTPRRHSLRGLCVFLSGRVRLFQTSISLLAPVRCARSMVVLSRSHEQIVSCLRWAGDTSLFLLFFFERRHTVSASSTSGTHTGGVHK